MDQDTKTSLLQSLSKSRACASGGEREKKLSVRIAAGLPGLNRTSIYYKHRNNKSAEEELACKALIDRIHTDNPSWGARQLSKQLRLQGFRAGRFRTMRFMREMGIDAIYPKMNLSKRLSSASSGDPQTERKLTPSVLSRGPGTGQRGSELAQLSVSFVRPYSRIFRENLCVL